MVKNHYLPSQGDLIKIDFNPQAGHEQKGWRPALVISVDEYIQRTGFVICCPITNTKRDTPFHVALPDDLDLTGYVMCEQIKSMDFRKRGAKKVSTAPTELLQKALAMIDACLYPAK